MENAGGTKEEKRLKGTVERVAVLMGGASGEREISLDSGRCCAEILRKSGYEVFEVDTKDSFVDKIIAIQPDVCLNALHGFLGEDGTVQGVLEYLGIPYTHSGVLASASGLDKHVTRLLLQDAGLVLAPGCVANSDTVIAEKGIKPPYLIKPRFSGSSLGLKFVFEDDPMQEELAISQRFPRDQYPDMWDDFQDSRDVFIVEKYIPGRELTTCVLNDEALAVTEIIFDGKSYDYDTKYDPAKAKHVTPSNLPESITQKCLEYALKAHRVLGCRQLSRTDFRLDDSLDDPDLWNLVVLEINTQPGMTNFSIFPDQLRFLGKTMAEGVCSLVEGAVCRR